MAQQSRNPAELSQMLEASEFAGKSKGSSASTLSEFLWESTVGDRHRAIDSKFIRGIRSKNLRPEDFGGYLLQEAVFLYYAKNNIDTAASRASENLIRKFLEKKADLYKKIYSELFERWHINDPKGIALDDSCVAYINQEEKVAKSQDSIYFLVALIPYVKLRSWLGDQLEATRHDFGVYTHWVKTELDPDVKRVAAMESFIDGAEMMGAVDRKTALEVYTHCMKGEADFLQSIHAD